MSEGTAATANDYQVGGTHYRTGEGKLQHWDLITKYGIDYLRGCASKYVSRARKKSGPEDLEKGDHYLQKWLESPSILRREAVVPIAQVITWARGAGLTVQELEICIMILCWGQIDEAREAIKVLREDLYSVDQLAEIMRPGTPEDGGHHGLTEADLVETPQHT